MWRGGKSKIRLGGVVLQAHVAGSIKEMRAIFGWNCFVRADHQHLISSQQDTGLSYSPPLHLRFYFSETSLSTNHSLE